MKAKYDVDMNRSLGELRFAISKDMSYLPEFIDTKKSNHKQCFSIFSYILEAIDRLIYNKILTKSKITQVISYIETLFGDMALVDENITIQYYMYSQIIINCYAEYCKDNELWEVLSNIRSFFEGFYKTKLDFNYGE